MQDLPPAPDGARPVGKMADASPIARTVIWAIRAWLEEGEGPDAVRCAFDRALGPKDGACAAMLMEGYFLVLARHHARPLQRHHLRCPCIGSDEARLACVVEHAALGLLAPAIAEASEFLRPDGLAALLDAAAPLGRALLRSRADVFPAREPDRLASAPPASRAVPGAARSLSIH